MAAGNFDRVLPNVLIHEGGNDDDPHDHGGRTSRGIIQREYDAYRGRKGQPVGDVWKASDAEIREIYLMQYWQPWCEQLPDGLDYVYFDFAVNAGAVQAARSLQRALGTVTVDGHMGIVTVQACVDNPDIPGLIHRYSDQRRAFYQALAQFPRYGNGWMRRANECEQAAIALANEQPAPKVTPDDQWTGKANSADVKKAPVKQPAVVATAGGAVVAAAASSGASGKVIVAILIATVIIAGIAYAIARTRS